MESRKQNEIPQQVNAKLGKKIIQALKTQNASSQPKSPINTSSSPVVEDNSFVTKTTSPIGLDVIDHMDFGSQGLLLDENKNKNIDQSQSYPDPFAISDDSGLVFNQQVQEYGSFITPEETVFSEYDIQESHSIKDNPMLEDSNHLLNDELYEDYDYDNSNYQDFQSHVPPEFEAMESYNNNIIENNSQKPNDNKLYQEEDFLSAGTVDFSEQNSSMLDYSDEYENSHQFGEENYFSPGFDFEAGEDYSIGNEEELSDDILLTQETVEEEFNPQIGYKQEDIIPASKKLAKIVDLDSVVIEGKESEESSEVLETPKFISNVDVDVDVDESLEEPNEDSYDEQIAQQEDSYDLYEEDNVPDDFSLNKSLYNKLYNEEQEEDFIEMSKNIYQEEKEIMTSKVDSNIEENPKISFDKSQDKDYRKFQERSYESNKDNRKMEDKISFKDDKEFKKSEEKYFVQHDKDYRRHEDKYYPEMEKDYKRYEDKNRHRDYKNYEEAPSYNHERDHIKHDDRLSSNYERDLRKSDERHYLEKETYHPEYSRETYRSEDRHHGQRDRDYSRFEIKDEKPEKDYRRHEERYYQPEHNYDKFNVKYYDPDRDYHRYDKFPLEQEKEYIQREETNYYDDRDVKYRNKTHQQDSSERTDLYNANVETLIRLVLSLPQGVTKQTGAHIIKQTMEAMGISINDVLADAQESQSKIRRHIKDSYNSIDEYKMHVRQLEDEIYQYQKKAKDLDDIVSLFVYSDQPKQMR